MRQEQFHVVLDLDCDCGAKSDEFDLAQIDHGHQDILSTFQTLEIRILRQILMKSFLGKNGKKKSINLY